MKTLAKEGTGTVKTWLCFISKFKVKPSTVA